MFSGPATVAQTPNVCDYCILQFPSALSATSGTPTETVYGRIFEAGITEAPGDSPTVRAQVGYGAVGTDPRIASGWIYFEATFNVQVGNDDEYQASMIAPAQGNYRYVYRFSLDDGASWSYADLDGAGSNPGLTFDPNNLGAMNVSPSGPPTVATSAATLITPIAATLNGVANPNGGATSGWFRYSTISPGTCNDTFGVRAPTSDGAVLGMGNTSVPYSHPLTGLAPMTTYYFCAIASNSIGTSFGSLMSFATPPCAVTLTPNSQYFGSAASTGTISVAGQDGCSWSAVSNAPWLTVTSGSTGLGNGTVGFSVSANSTSVERIGTIAIGDKVFSVVQSYGDCLVALLGGADIPTGASRNIGVGVADTTGRGIVSFSMTITYDPTVATFAGVDKSGTLSSGFTVGGNVISPGTIRVAGFGTSPLVGSGNLISLIFTASGPVGSTTPLNFTSIQFNEGGCVQVMGGGYITIVGRTVSGSVLYGTSSTPLSIAGVRIDGFGSPSAAAFTDATGAYSITGLGTGALALLPSLPVTPPVNGITALDASLVLQAVLGTTTLSANQLIAADVSGNGSVTPFDAALIAKFVVELPNTVYAGTWRFSPAQRNHPSLPADLTGQDFSLILMGEVTGNWSPQSQFVDSLFDVNERSGEILTEWITGARPPAASSIKLALPSITVPNGVVLIPLTLGNYNGQIVTSYQFDLRFDPNVLVPTSAPIDVANSLSDGYAFEFNWVEPGRIRVAVYGVNSIASNGTLVNLRFNVIGSPKSRSDLVLERTFLNEGQPGVSVQHGKITVKR